MTKQTKQEWLRQELLKNEIEDLIALIGAINASKCTAEEYINYLIEDEDELNSNVDDIIQIFEKYKEME